MEATVVATKARVWRARQQLESRARKDEVLSSFLVDDPAARIGDDDAGDAGDAGENGEAS